MCVPAVGGKADTEVPDSCLRKLQKPRGSREGGKHGLKLFSSLPCTRECEGRTKGVLRESMWSVLQRAMGDGKQSPEKQKAESMFWECGQRSPAEWPPVSLREHLWGKEWL